MCWCEQACLQRGFGGGGVGGPGGEGLVSAGQRAQCSIQRPQQLRPPVPQRPPLLTLNNTADFQRQGKIQIQI